MYKEQVQKRILTVLVILSLGFLSLEGWMTWMRNQSTQELVDYRQNFLQQNLIRMVKRLGLTLRSACGDYSQWTEMQVFSENLDRRWAKVNIDTSLPEFGITHTWVVNPEYQTVYRFVVDNQPELEQPLQKATLKTVKGLAFYQGFYRHKQSIFELAACPLNSSDDYERLGSTTGWLVLAQPVSDDYLKQIALLTDSDSSIVLNNHQSLTSTLNDPWNIRIALPLRGTSGQAVAFLVATTVLEDLKKLYNASTQLIIVNGFSIICLLLLTYFLLQVWVLSPLKRLTNALDKNTASELNTLLARDDEYGRLASLVNDFFRQRDLLAAEIQKRGQVMDQLAQVNLQLFDNARLDELTQVANRRRFDEYLMSAWSSAISTGNPIALLMIDLDYFKRYNDTLGHPEGDDCLALVAEVFRNVVKSRHDLLARYGGEEFAAILPLTDEAGAKVLAGRIIEGLKQAAIPHPGSEFQVVTTSIGVAACSPIPHQNPDMLINMADKALYEAKRRGRNGVVAFSELPKNVDEEGGV
ncbi:sensor domain-containing diguanylate cyclase [Zooshikella harenae]|uniref:diguanylate cyclase n=1 Tax=Zooshikella harenae TaxID=2827238 RepID=A0ABS5ZIE1_9GAMM|nr:diguanylate cyclase [Zooshikella harenae]MBU2713740.1 diguanylate cyclase [Zooshikella harenae]